MTTPPSFRKVNPGDFPILYISLNSPTLPLSVVDEYGEITLAQQISQLPGVAQVLVYGAQKFAVRVQVDPVAAAARNISLEDIRSVVAKTNSNTPVGTLNGPKQSVTLTASGAMTKAEEYRKVVVAYRNGAPVHLDEIARVIDSVENDKIASWFNDNRADRAGDPAPARRQHGGGGRLRCASGCRSTARRCRPSINMEVLMDRSISIRESVHGRAGDAADRDRPGHHGDLPVPAHGLGDHHSGAGGAGLADRHLRGDVRVRISRSTT